MSYEPILIINANHLEAVEFEDWYDTATNKGVVMDHLRHVRHKYPVNTLSGVRFYLDSPALSRFNRAIREMLTKLNVEFAEVD